MLIFNSNNLIGITEKWDTRYQNFTNLSFIPFVMNLPLFLKKNFPFYYIGKILPIGVSLLRTTMVLSAAIVYVGDISIEFFSSGTLSYCFIDMFFLMVRLVDAAILRCHGYLTQRKNVSVIMAS
jgi:hypothetical protein